MAVKVVYVPGLEEALERLIESSPFGAKLEELERRVEELERRNDAPEGGKER